MNILVVNTDSLLNPGDAAIVLSQIRLLRQLRPECRIDLTSRTPRLDLGFFGPLGVTVHPPLLPAPSLWRGAGRKAVGSLVHILRLPSKARLLKAFRRVDLVVSCGGGPFYSNKRRRPGLTFGQNVLHVRLAQALNKPVVFFPQSFGPLASEPARRSVRRLLAHPKTAAILVREPKSMAALEDLLPAEARARLAPCPDMAFRLSPPTAPSRIPLPPLPRPRLLVTVRDWDFPEAPSPEGKLEMRNRYLEAVREAAARFARGTGGGLAVVPHTRGPGDFEDDRIPSRRLYASLQADLPPDRLALLDIPDESSPDDLLALYAEADLLLATRTHAAIFGLLAGRPVVSIHYQPKGLGLMAAVGLADRSLPIAELDADRLTAALDQAAARPPDEAGSIAARIADLRLEIEAAVGRALDAAERLR